MWGGGCKLELDIESLLKKAGRVSGNQAEIIVARGRSSEVSAESGAFSDSSEEEYFGFGVRIVRRGRVGFSFGNQAERFDSILSKAVENSKIGGRLASLPDSPGRYPKVPGLYDRKVAEISGRELIERVKEIVSSVREAGAKPTYAGAEASSGEVTVANSNGIFSRMRESSVSGGCYANSGGSTGFEGKSSRKDNLDYGEFGRVAGGRAVEGRKQKKLGTKKGIKILLHPYAVEGLLGGALLPSVDGENVFRGNSSLAGKIGTGIFSENLSIEDNGILPGENGSSEFDSEGVPCRRTEILSKGVLKNFLYNWETGLRAGLPSTGNGFRSFAATPKIRPTNIVVSPGSERTRALAKEAELSVLWFSGTHTINPFSGEFSVEAKNSFSLRNGERAFATKPGIVSGNIFQVLKTVEVAKDGVERAGSFITPHILIEGDFIS